jgi:hypothetical protein
MSRIPFATRQALRDCIDGSIAGLLWEQLPSKHQMVVNLKAAKAIELSIPSAFILRADEVLE